MKSMRLLRVAISRVCKKLWHCMIIITHYCFMTFCDCYLPVICLIRTLKPPHRLIVSYTVSFTLLRVCYKREKNHRNIKRLGKYGHKIKIIIHKFNLEA